MSNQSASTGASKYVPRAQEDSDKWEYQKHHTISTDHTGADIIQKNLLLAATDPSKAPHLQTSAGQESLKQNFAGGNEKSEKLEGDQAGTEISHAKKDYQMQLALLEMANKKRLMASYQGQVHDHFVAPETLPQKAQADTPTLSAERARGAEQWIKTFDRDSLESQYRGNLPLYTSTGSLDDQLALSRSSPSMSEMMGMNGAQRSQSDDMNPYNISGVLRSRPEDRVDRSAYFQGKAESQLPLRNSQSSSIPVVFDITKTSTFDHYSRHGDAQDLHQQPSTDLFVMAQLQSQIQELREENQRLKTNALESAKSSRLTWQTFHYIMEEEGDYHHEGDKSDGGESAFLAEPSWTMTGGRLRLKGHSPISDTHTYMRKEANLAFVVHNYYAAEHKRADVKEALKKDEPLPSPEPASQTIRIISKKLAAATKAFLTRQQDFHKEFPKFNVDLPMQAPYLWWYRYRSTRLTDHLTHDETDLLQVLTSWISDNYSELYNHVDSQIHRGLVSYVSMEFLIQPGDVLVSTTEDNIEACVAISRILPRRNNSPHTEADIDKVESEAPEKFHTWKWLIDTWKYSYDGGLQRQLETVCIKIHSKSAEDEVSISDLNIVPLKFLDEGIRIKLQQRGRTFWNCRKRRLVSYVDENPDVANPQGERFMVDFKTYKKLHPDSDHVEPATRRLGVQMPTNDFERDEPPAEPDLLLLPNQIVGFELRRKKWKNLKVDRVRDVCWNNRAFEHLVANEETKELVQALVTNQLATEQGTDVIANKGNGLIMLLHGGPGTGKTFTAESVAEIARKPLYPVTCGDIGTKIEQVEAYLESVFHLGKLWGCVVLLDEAEVFLEQRTLSDLDRNALVSVFLRALEYYEGILILTSNRVGTFDEAFKSRIQLALHYQPLRKPQRRQIWKNFFDHLDGMIDCRIDFVDIERHLDRLSEFEMNGRQIRNSITTARQLAGYKKETMTFAHLRHAIQVTGEFDNYLKNVNHGHGDEDIAREDRVR